jgi:hypothetical protein
VSRLSQSTWHVVLGYDLAADVRQDDYHVLFRLGMQAAKYWAPHLTPAEGYIIEQHVFRTPAVLARGGGKTVILLPDIDRMDKSAVRWYMDMDAQSGLLRLGMSESEICDHVLYKKAPGAVYSSGRHEFGFILFLFDEELENPFRPVLDFYWRRYGHEAFMKRCKLSAGLNAYVIHTYRWAFDCWKNVVWQEFEAGGIAVGAPVFIVTASQSPNYPGTPKERELRSIWNQAWFCSLRSASGLYRHARRNGDTRLMQYALKTKELALCFEQDDGLFDSVVATEMESFLSNGVAYQRSLGWETRYFGNSDRNPFCADVRTAPRHILDMSFTAYYMLMWYEELERDKRLERYARAYADK